MTINEQLVLSKLIDIVNQHKDKYSHIDETKVLNWDNFDEINPYPKDLIDESNLPYIKGEYQVFFSYKDIINESYEERKFPDQTMLGEFVKNNLPEMIGLPKDYIEVVYDESVSDKIPRVVLVTYPSVVINEYTKNKLDEIFYTMGYFLSANRRREDDYNTLQYEPYYYERVTLVEELYHSTTVDNAEEIQKTGFKPRHDSSLFKYPPRCYFWLYYDEYLMTKYMYKSKKLDSANKDSNEYAVIEINGKLTGNRFYQDPLMMHSGAYTYEPVDAKYITDVTAIYC